jgi:tetratricopeptide (TPR) repeat protein
LHETSQKELLANLKELLIHISPYVENVSSSYWNEMQSVLMRDKYVKDKLKINSTNLKQMLYELKKFYSNNYNYWLQLGIAEQTDKDYEKALNHFTQAEALGPNSYMVKNAIGKNYILQAITEEDRELGKELFLRGKDILFDLIGTKEEFQVKAYSIHTYITCVIKFYTKHKGIKITKKEIEEAQLLLDKMLNKDSEDILFNDVNKRFQNFLLRTNSGNVKFNLHQIQQLYEQDNDELW